jgi:hypothetical protein
LLHDLIVSYVYAVYMYVINLYINTVIIAEDRYITGPIQFQKYYDVQYTLFPNFNQNLFGFYAIMKSTTFPAFKTSAK